MASIKNPKSKLAACLLTAGLLVSAVGCTPDGSDSSGPDAPSYSGTAAEQMGQWSDATDNGNRSAVESAQINIVTSIPESRPGGDKDVFTTACETLETEVDLAKESPPMPDEEADGIWREALDSSDAAVPLCKKLVESEAEADFIEMSENLSDSMNEFMALDERIAELGPAQTSGTP